MKTILTIFLCIVNFTTLDANDNSKNVYTVYLFLLEDCKITQALTSTLNELYQKYSSDSIQFVGLFPNTVSEQEAVQKFQQKNKLPFICTLTDAVNIAKKYAVSITPEVVVVNSTTNEVYYQGRINNLFERVGIRRKVVTKHDLQEVLEKIVTNKKIEVKRTKPIGCILTL